MNASTADVATLQAEITTLKADYDESLDTIWMLLAAVLVFFMHAGFSLLEAGSVRSKNVQNILVKNLLVVSIGFLCWYLFGYALAFGTLEKPGKFAGGTNFVMDGLWANKDMLRFWFFQGAFCATGATIVSGAMAERTQLKGFAVYTTLMTAVIYPVVVYWGWSGSGFLNYTNDDGEGVSAFGPGYMDFAGSGIVHLVGGVGALCGAVFVGPRKGRFVPDSTDDFNAQNVPFQVLATFALWFGWYGFNAGSTGAMHDKATANTAGLVAVNTTLAPCIAGIVVFILRAKVCSPQLLDVGGFCNGILAGLVSITAGCANVEPWESLIIGFVGAFVYQGASMILKRLRVDDVVDAVPVHAACGTWGVLALGFFGNPEKGMGGNGILYGGDQLGVQLVACIIIILWVAAISVVVFLPLRLLNMLRLSDEFQDAGADLMEHSPPKAYVNTEASTEEKGKTDTFNV